VCTYQQDWSPNIWAAPLFEGEGYYFMLVTMKRIQCKMPSMRRRMILLVQGRCVYPVSTRMATTRMVTMVPTELLQVETSI
jgi:hypothetical protein